MKIFQYPHRVRTGMVAAALALTTVFAPSLVQAQQAHPVHFAAGTDHASYSGVIQGDHAALYTVSARKGQTMIVDFSPSTPRAYFNVTPPGNGPSIFVGADSGSHFSGTLPVDGTYKIDVFLIRAAARRNESSNYSMTITIPADGASHVTQVAGGYADGLSGGPDFWAVTGIASGDRLNLRSSPSTNSKIIDKLANGTVLRNRGCEKHGRTVWCMVQTTQGAKIDGWVSSRYLRESGGPGAISTSGHGNASMPVLRDLGNGTYSVDFASGCSQLYNREGSRLSAGSSCSEAEFTAGRIAIDSFRAEQGL